MKKRTVVLALLMIFLLSVSLCGCGDASAKDAKEAPQVSKEDDYIDVNSVDDSSKDDLDKYKEEQSTTTTAGKEAATGAGSSDSTKKANGSGANMSTSSSSGEKLDEYKTEAPPAGKPSAVEPEEAKVNSSKQLTCTIFIECSTILNNMADFNEDKLSVLPSDGVILSKRTVNFSEGESVFDVLLRETKNNKIHMEYSMTPMYNSNYIEGINNLYEFDCGSGSGWMYRVNGWYPNYGCSRYQLKAGDAIEWNYTCDLGVDLGETQYQDKE